ncbi:Viral phytochrome-like protein [Ectocarpus siliculosus]|uniref:histidine kinase n=1 Tax=Ectocarpus siliculosus TaxID=2880 RepID=D8LPK0_ECTSI|nr:Viral phytochrome-like protein [Ectocarpus siliculosus]|eukprot:CBN80472.1 Viral phytochrome-like protein [Ectocarpus siliculosus]
MKMTDRASDCDLLDLAKIAEIQSEGFLVCTHFKRDSMRLQIRNVSSNIGDAPFSLPAVRRDPHLFVGKCVPDCFSESFADRISALFQRHLGNRSARCSYTCDSPHKRRYLVTASRTTDGLVFEVFPDDNSPLEAFDMGHGGDLCALLVHTEQAALFEAACAAVTASVDYDRSMVYQFQEDLSGKVVYEAIKPSVAETLDPYLNTFFPESDIPLPARQMFLIRPVCVMFDNDLSPVEIVGDRDMDTSKCILRSSHPIHRSYMQNMGVRSSLSIGIVVNNELWGLLCFHSYGGSVVHPTGREIGYFENLSAQVSVCLSNIQSATSARRQTALSAIVDKGLSAGDLLGFFAENAPDLLRLMESDCVSIRLGHKKVKHWGDADLVLSGTDLDRVSRNAFGKDWCLEEIDRPSRGVLGIIHGNLSVVFVRKSTPCDKAWAGDPTHVKMMRPDGVPGPRGSFERYIQSGADRLNQWNAQDREMATYLSSRIDILVSTTKFFADRTKALVLERGDGCVRYDTEKTPVSLDAALISHLSHELKTPLHGVSSVLTLLSEEQSIGNADLQQQLGYGLECLDTISKVVESVLTAASGRAHRKIESVCLERFVDSLAEKYAGNNNLTVTITVPENYTRVMVDADLLHKTICGIIDNSTSAGSMVKPTHLSLSCCSTHREATMAWKSRTRKYAHRNIRNSEDTSNISDSDWWYTFSVQDPGCGIHRDMVDNVLAFNDSSRTTTTVTNSHQGIGVGVYRCIANVFELNGSIGIASTVSKGTIVSVMLPAQVVVADESTVQGVPEAEDVFFVVDDNTVNRRLASRLVKVAFRKTTGAVPLVEDFADGRLCIEEIKRMRESGKQILGILMDHHMPVMSGKEATQFIRHTEAQEGLEKIPIFGFTADSTDSTKKELLDAGMDDVLPKPMSMKALEQTCIKILSRKES